VPTRGADCRPSPDAQKSLLLDLSTLKLRPRRGHDLRRTFITLAQVNGARRDLLQAITQGPRGDIVSANTTFPWPALCAEVKKLRLELRERLLLAMQGLPAALPATQRSARNLWEKTATPAGFEPAFMP
jgi:hypothetical protein